MSLASEIKAIIDARIPDAKFVLASDFKANVNSYYDAPYTVTAPLVILDNELEETDTINQNMTFNTETKIQLTFLSKDTVNDSTDQEVNDNIIEPLKIAARGVYGAIYQLDNIRFQENQTARITMRPKFRAFNSVLSGVTCIARWNYNQVTNVCKV
jgi:hypothetical protein